jgi:DNA-binding response OmpR family regulator
MSTAADSSSRVPARPLRILVVEDDTTLRGLLQRALSNAGYQVVTAVNGRVAMTLLGGSRFDLIVTDIYMPEGDGVELMTHLRTAAPALPTIAMSAGDSEQGDVMLGVVRHLGARHVLEKPFSLQLLLDAVGETIGLPPGEAPVPGV